MPDQVPAGHRMEFRILGPIEAVGPDGASLALGGNGPRALLAALLLQQGLAVTRDRLVEALWEAPPESAPHAIEVYVSRLRRTLGSDRIRRQGHAYRAAAAAEELDLSRFRTLARTGRDALRQGDLERGADSLQAALATWSGTALGCLNGEPLAAEARRHLEEERLAAAEALLDCRLALGHHEELVPELHELATAHPSRERLWGRLMLALYRSARQLDALEVYARRRARLHDELGIEPGPELRDLQRRILAHDPALAGPRAPEPRVSSSAP
jgi:DNA-binding SARP family transcriptional activator